MTILHQSSKSQTAICKICLRPLVSLSRAKEGSIPSCSTKSLVLRRFRVDHRNPSNSSVPAVPTNTLNYMNTQRNSRRARVVLVVANKPKSGTHTVFVYRYNRMHTYPNHKSWRRARDKSLQKRRRWTAESPLAEEPTTLLLLLLIRRRREHLPDVNDAAPVVKQRHHFRRRHVQVLVAPITITVHIHPIGTVRPVHERRPSAIRRSRSERHDGLRIHEKIPRREALRAASLVRRRVPVLTLA